VGLPQFSLQRSRLVSMLHQAPVPRLVDVSQRMPRAQQRPPGNPAEPTNPNPSSVRATDTTAAGTAIWERWRALLGWRADCYGIADQQRQASQTLTPPFPSHLSRTVNKVMLTRKSIRQLKGDRNA
jgi:hypothetical protein